MSLRAFKLGLFAAMFGLAAAALYTAALVTDRQNTVSDLSRYNTSWFASQGVNEFMRLEKTLAMAAVPGSAVGADDVELRLDIVANRLKLMRAGDFGAFLRASPERTELLEQLDQMVDTATAAIADGKDPSAYLRVLDLMAPLDARLLELAAAANRYGGDRAAADQRELMRLHWLFTLIVSGLFILGMLLLLLLAWHNNMLGRAHGKLRHLASDLRRTSLDLERANGDISLINAELQGRNDSLLRRDRELGLQNRRFDAALNNMTHALCMVDSANRLVVFNQRFAELFGVEITPLPGMPLPDLIEAAREPLGDMVARQQALASEATAVSFVHDAPERTISVSHQPTPEGGWVATYEDISNRRRAEAQIAFMTHHDSLTGLVNRSYFQTRLDAAVSGAEEHEPVAILSIDLDGFKLVNDTLGHAVGDALLRSVALRLEDGVRDRDLVARLGGDEFAVLQSRVRDRQDAAEIAARLLARLGEPFEIDGLELRTGASIGIALAPEHGTGAAELMKHADLALHRAKEGGRNTFQVFEPDMDVELEARRLLEADLRLALDRGEFELYFQPLTSVRSMATTGFEALLRWRHPTRGMVSPAEFIPVAEDIGIILPLGEWVLREACAAAARWPNDMTVAVNLSSVQFRSRSIVDAVLQGLLRSGLSARRLELEITESVLLDDNEATLSILHEFRLMGIRVAMDDFGTGYSSLSYLRSFPFDKIKIDQSFVREISTRPDCVTIVRSIAALGSSLGMTTTAEGVETSEQFDLLRAAGCDQVQGYYFGRPQPASALVFPEPAVEQPTPSLPRLRAV